MPTTFPATKPCVVVPTTSSCDLSLPAAQAAAERDPTGSGAGDAGGVEGSVSPEEVAAGEYSMAARAVEQTQRKQVGVSAQTRESLLLKTAPSCLLAARSDA